MGNQPTKHTTGKPKKAVHWKSAEPPAPPGRPALVPGSPSSAPDIVTIRWNRPATDGGSPILGYVVEQRRTGSPHWVRACPSLVQQTELSLSGLEPGWRYQFRVLAENIVGRSESSELSDPLTVTLQRNAISAPRFVHELFDATAVENEKVEFRVQVAGTPAPQIGWFKDGFEIYSSRRARIVTEGDASVLVIHQAALTDEGEIKCSATNRAGHSVTRCHLTIDALPKIRLPRQYEDGLIIAAEEVVRLKVGLAGRPAPAVEWSHNGEPLANDARHELVTSDKHTTLKLNGSRRADRGEYSIRAINKLGEDNASFLVTVTARPEPPGQVAVGFAYGKTATLRWAAPDDDGGCEIGNYIVEYYRVGWDVWLKAATCRQLTATLSDLIEGSQYRFRVKAENPYGLSDPGDESDVLFVADPRRGITDPSQMAPTQPATLPRKRRDQSRSPLRDATKKAFTPEPYGRADVIREMSYGTPIQGYRTYPAEGSSPGAEPPAPPAVVITPSAGAPLAEPESETESGDLRAGASLQAMQKLSREPSPLSQSLSPANSSDPMGSSASANEPVATTDTDTQPSAKAAIHNSSEFMLVLYNEQEAKKSTPSCRTVRFTHPAGEAAKPKPPWYCRAFCKDRFFLERLLTRRGYPRVLSQLSVRRSGSGTVGPGVLLGNSTFDFELDELVAPPPPLSLSAPELNVEPPPAPAMRAGVSSTELLYERAMARFYQAVAYEESENQRREAQQQQQQEQEEAVRGSRQQAAPLGPLQEEDNSGHATTTTTVSNRLADRRSSLRKRLSGDKESIVKQSSFEQEPPAPQQQRQPSHGHSHSTLAADGALTMAAEEAPRPRERIDSVGQAVSEGDEDSSVSSSMSSMLEEMRRREQQQQQQVLAHPKRRGFMDDDHDTDEEPYHPSAGPPVRSRSPYRNPDPSQAIEVLTRPMPRPDPNFVPKPILKRPSTEVLAKDDPKRQPPPAAAPQGPAAALQVSSRRSPQPRTPERERSPVARKASPEPAPPVRRQDQEEPAVSEPPRNQEDGQQQPPQPGVDEPDSAPLSERQPPAQEDIVRAIVSEEARQRRRESRQNSIEESRAVADFYSDMVQQIESSKKPRKLPLYMSPDEVRKLNEREYSRGSSRAGSRSPLPLEESSYHLVHGGIPRRTSRSPSLASDHPAAAAAVVQRSGKPARESKILRQRSASIESDVGPARPPSGARDAPPVVPGGPPPPAPPEESGRIGRAVERRRGSATGRNRSRSNSAARTGALGVSPKARQLLPSAVAPPATAAANASVQRAAPADLSLKQPPPEPKRLPAKPNHRTQEASEPEPTAATSPDALEEVGLKPTVSYLTDVALFAIACWLYLFKNPKLAIPVILLIMYRHIREAVKDRMPAWMRRKPEPATTS